MRRFYLDGEWASLKWFLKSCEECQRINCKWFSLTDFIFDSEFAENPIYKMFMDEMRPFVERTLNPGRWYGHSYESAKVYIFPFSQQVFHILKKYTKSVLLNDCVLAGDTMIPQDLNIFWEDGRILLGTVSHEGIADLYLEDEEVSEFSLPYGFEEGMERDDLMIDLKNEIY